MLDPLTSRGYKCHLNAEPMIVSTICIAGDLPETVVFGDPAGANLAVGSPFYCQITFHHHTKLSFGLNQI